MSTSRTDRENEGATWTVPVPASKSTVLDGYYASGDHECFCFDRWDGPDAYYAAFPTDGEDSWAQMDRQIAAQRANRVYPHDLLPDRAGQHYGRWTITVSFVPLPEPQEPRSSGDTQEGQS